MKDYCNVVDGVSVALISDSKVTTNDWYSCVNENDGRGVGDIEIDRGGGERGRVVELEQVK